MTKFINKRNIFLEGYPYKEYKVLGVLDQEIEVLERYRKGLYVYGTIGGARHNALEIYKKELENKFSKMERPYFVMDNFIDTSMEYMTEVIQDNYNTIIFNHLIDLVNEGLQYGDENYKIDLGYYGLIDAITEISKGEYMDIDSTEGIYEDLLKLVEMKKQHI